MSAGRSTAPNGRAIVVGAGIVGVSTALALQSRGFETLLLDRKRVAAEASAGNAGAFAFSDVTPLARPGIIARAPRWLFDPEGPLAIPPSYALRLAPWLFRFALASRLRSHRAATRAQLALMRECDEALSRQAADAGLGRLIRRDGQLQLYEGDRAWRAAEREWRFRAAHGVAFDRLEAPEAIAELQPGLSPQFTHAVFTPDWSRTIDPLRWTQGLADVFIGRGGGFAEFEASRIVPQDDAVDVHASGRGATRAGLAVICAGAWSHRLSAPLGDRVSLETERGYNVTLPAGAFDLRLQLTFDDHGFVATPIGDGVRIGGGVELGGLTAPPNWRRADAMLTKARRFLPDLRADDGKGERWMGFRPSTPDGLPVIGRSRRSPRVLYAFGHGHLGLTQAAGTAELIAALATGARPAIDIDPFRPDRF